MTLFEAISKHLTDESISKMLNTIMKYLKPILKTSHYKNINTRGNSRNGGTSNSNNISNKSSKGTKKSKIIKT